jgi:predicted metal-dependent enzyme (double-stranded beta helix superfamily)
MKKLIEALKALKGKEIDPNLVRQVLESVNLKTLSVEEELKHVKKDAFNRQIVLDDPVQVFLMTWTPQFFYPIHQHNNFWGFVVPVKGFLSETIYGYAPNKRKVFIHPTKTFREGELIYEPMNVIHKLQNTSPIDSMVTLHVYYPPVYNFKGTTIFDAKNRRLAVLNEKAGDLSWDLPKDNFELVEEEAYELEKLW